MRQHRAPSPAGRHGHPTSPSCLSGPPPI
uniref:Uncharacterized protein n=1 Tax=Arundo donax TaxID=35708 RepID=A0A0A9EIL3_ARUDO